MTITKVAYKQLIAKRDFLLFLKDETETYLLVYIFYISLSN